MPEDRKKSDKDKKNRKDVGRSEKDSRKPTRKKSGDKKDHRKSRSRRNEKYKPSDKKKGTIAHKFLNLFGLAETRPSSKSRKRRHRPKSHRPVEGSIKHKKSDKPKRHTKQKAHSERPIKVDHIKKTSSVRQETSTVDSLRTIKNSDFWRPTTTTASTGESCVEDTDTASEFPPVEVLTEEDLKQICRQPKPDGDPTSYEVTKWNTAKAYEMLYKYRKEESTPKKETEKKEELVQKKEELVQKKEELVQKKEELVQKKEESAQKKEELVQKK